MSFKEVGNKKYELRTYKNKKTECISFAKVDAPFGGLHNMSPKYPIQILNQTVKSSEHLYQICRFPFNPEIQEKILKGHNGMVAKIVMKENIDYSREDWDEVKIPIMKWCLMMKLLCNWESFGGLILFTGDKNLVEYSKKDDFWGAMPNGYELTGVNALGRLLMGVRSEIQSIEDKGCYTLTSPNVPDFLFLNQRIENCTFNNLNKLIPIEN